MENSTIRHVLSRHLANIRGWRTNRKIIVVESDDWGSIRMPDKTTFDILLSKGIPVNKCPYSMFDSLASEEDLDVLFNTLDKYRDINNNHPVFTANCVLANPDFEAIREADFLEYRYELFTETLKKYPNHSKSFDKWKEGISSGLFKPQFHGREHLNVSRWMDALRKGLPETRLAFSLKMFGISTDITTEVRKSYLAAFDVDSTSGEETIKEILNEGIAIFNETFGYIPKSFIAPNYRWSVNAEKQLSENKIMYIQGQRLQLSPSPDFQSLIKIPHFMGQTNAYGQIFTVRNCSFEPSLRPGRDSLSECLAQIQTAFFWGKPAIITSHRLNYIGTIVKKNRDSNIKTLDSLLNKILVRWPETEFMTSDELGDTIAKSMSL